MFGEVNYEQLQDRKLKLSTSRWGLRILTVFKVVFSCLQVYLLLILKLKLSLPHAKAKLLDIVYETEFKT